jgi:hypothetical protein
MVETPVSISQTLINKNRNFGDKIRLRIEFLGGEKEA